MKTEVIAEQQIGPAIGSRSCSMSTTSSRRSASVACCGRGSALRRSGLELFSAAGPEAIGAFADLGYRVFLDLKLHDIPTTVHRAAASSARSASTT